MMTPRTNLTRRILGRSTHRRRAFPFSSAAAAAAARRCSSSCANGSAARRRCTSTSSAPRRRPSVSCGPSSPRRRFRSASRRRPAPAPRSTPRSPSSCRARTGSGEPVTMLLDEFLEMRTFESFPGLRRVLHDLIDGLTTSGNRFVLTSRYVARTLRLLRDRSSRFEVIHMPALTAEDTLDILGLAGGHRRRPRARAPNTRAHGAVARRRPAGVRAGARRRAVVDARARRRSRRQRSDWRAGGADGARGPALQALQLLLRAAPPPGARLRRAQGDPRDSGRRGRADADRNLAAAAAHARLDEGLPVVARGRRPGHRAGRSATASPTRCCASGCACTAARPRRPKTTSPAKCTATRCRACRSSRSPANSPPKPRTRWPRPASSSGIIEID